MKTFKQKKRRSRARKRDREKSIWRYMGMNHVCPNSTKPFNRKYYIFDDVSKTYIPDVYNQGYSRPLDINGKTLDVTDYRASAGKFENFIADRYIRDLKGYGAWRAIRVE